MTKVSVGRGVKVWPVFSSVVPPDAPELQPSVQMTNLVASEITNDSAVLTWARGNGHFVILTARASSSFPASVPSDGNTYVADSEYGNGSPVGLGFCVYNDTGTSFQITGLASETTYYIKGFEYNINSGEENYLTNVIVGFENSIAFETL